MFHFKDEEEYREWVDRQKGKDYSRPDFRNQDSPEPPAKVDLAEVTTQDRFRIRQEIHRENGTPLLYHHLWWFVHNCIAHPLIGVIPCRPTFEFHDYTSRKLMGE